MSENVPLTRMNVDDVVRLLKQAGAKQASAEFIAELQKRGAPTNEDGTINFVAFTAWCVREVAP